MDLKYRQWLSQPILCDCMQKKWVYTSHQNFTNETVQRICTRIFEIMVMV